MTGTTRPFGPDGASSGGPHRAARHLGAMHLSGVILLLTYVIPPAWALDAYGAAPSSDPSADTPPFAIFAVMLFHCVVIHTLVQIPSGVLGTRFGRNRGPSVVYASALAMAGILTALVLWLTLQAENVGEFMQLWADFMARVSLGLAGYVWVTKGSRKTAVR
ncbi:hypothetical protein [Streptomyces sp. NPDC026673]|uniref:hypothetical protein n=1 Tax=Streptomyces sp. NPDC026673 TaxID=3155724 RepID=UPI0033CEB433